MCHLIYSFNLTILQSSVNSDHQRVYKPTSLYAVPGRPVGDATLLAKVVAIVPTTATPRVRHALVMLGVSQGQVPATSGELAASGSTCCEILPAENKQSLS
jgi:hypothetical protein